MIHVAQRFSLFKQALALAVVVAALPGCGSKTTSSNAPKIDEAKPQAIARETSSYIGSDNTAAKPSHQRDEILATSDQLIAQRDHAAAKSALKNLLLADPHDSEALFRLANIEADLGDLRTAVALLDEIPADHSDAGLPALGQSADWCFQLKQYDEAERRYRKVLEHAPQAAPALRQLAYMLNRQGRRHEAAQFVRELCKLGNVRQDELHSLIALSDAMYDPPSEPTQAGQHPYWPIGPAGEARKQFNEESFQQALAMLHVSVADGNAAPAVMALYGRAAAEAQDDSSFQWWLARTDDRTREFADYWAALGAHLLTQQRFEEAARALAEAIDRDPTDLVSISRMRQTLGILGDDAAAQRWFDRWSAVHDTVEANNRVAADQPPNPKTIAALAAMLSKLDRRLEALLWKSIQAHYEGTSQSEMPKLNARLEKLLASGTTFPSQQSRLCGLDLEAYPMPSLRTPDVTANVVNQIVDDDRRATPAKFKNFASKIGLQHTFFVESKPKAQHFAIYQTLGGGIAVLDYDLDGRRDLYLAQGAADPPTFRADQTNQLFRNNDLTLVDVTDNAAAVENQYSVGVTAGDWNQDGFPDLVVANIGTIMLMINNGDGTYRRRNIGSDNTNRVPTSSAIADVTGDQLPDLFQVCYIDDPTMVAKPPLDETGQVLLTVSPNNFKACPDLLFKNDAAGGFLIAALGSENVAYTGLGVVVADFDGQVGNEVFVGNDTFPNRLWVRDETIGKFTDVAPVRGCAYGFTGGATGAMGIATGDFDNNGTLDIHITNYENENANLFLHKGGAYQDRNVQYRLGAASKQLVGFGSQAIDYDNDGRLDLVVTNGHLDDAKSIRGTYAQPLQLFCNLGDRFQLVDTQGMSAYWQSNHVGRGLAKLDFNQDGMQDFLITHVGQPTALLINETPSDHHWLQLVLVGTTTERDSIGARVRLRLGQQQLSQWVVAGDGYLSRNENVVCFGLGQTTKIDELVIDWPSGTQQVFQNLPTDRRLLVVENEGEPFTLFSAP